MAINNIVFIDSRVAGYETLTLGLDLGTEWYLLNAEKDGVEQMQRILTDYTNLDSIHVISHGSPGTLYLGGTVLNSDNIFSYESELQGIGSSLTETRDILLYGCNVAQGYEGQANQEHGQPSEAVCLVQSVDGTQRLFNMAQA